MYLKYALPALIAVVPDATTTSGWRVLCNAEAPFWVHNLPFAAITQVSINDEFKTNGALLYMHYELSTPSHRKLGVAVGAWNSIDEARAWSRLPMTMFCPLSNLLEDARLASFTWGSWDTLVVSPVQRSLLCAIPHSSEDESVMKHITQDIESGKTLLPPLLRSFDLASCVQLVVEEESNTNTNVAC
jgi:hypothetical protein